jgi:hypothetical protein
MTPVREAKLPQIQVRMDRGLRDAVEERRRQEPDCPSRPEMIRRLMKEAMAARQDSGHRLPRISEKLVGVADA